MEKKKVDLTAVAAEAGKNAKAFWGKTKDAIISIADQNDDGSLDFKDVSVIAPQSQVFSISGTAGRWTT